MLILIWNIQLTNCSCVHAQSPLPIQEREDIWGSLKHGVPKLLVFTLQPTAKLA
uniref:Uncharacterized protein n=1 Tax=Anguilla anguilla TaxID=7936 RepID=A0A0E9SAP7_ANGAN